MLGLITINPLCSIAGLSLASPSLLAPSAALAPVWVILLSHPLIGDIPTARQSVASVIIVMGATIVGLFGDHTTDEDFSNQTTSNLHGDEASSSPTRTLADVGYLYLLFCCTCW